MRDAFGGAFLIKLFLVFILIYICFTALALNYAKAFKVKDRVIQYLENNEIYDLNEMNYKDEEALEQFIEYEILQKMNYNVGNNKICEGVTTRQGDKRIAICHPSGIVIEQAQINSNDKNTEGTYYTVSTYFGWTAPFLNVLLNVNGNKNDGDVLFGTWKISGQTRVIVGD